MKRRSFLFSGLASAFCLGSLKKSQAKEYPNDLNDDWRDLKPEDFPVEVPQSKLIKIIYGVHEHSIALPICTVEEVHKAFKAIFGMPNLFSNKALKRKITVLPYVNGKRVDPKIKLNPGDVLEFMTFKNLKSSFPDDSFFDTIPDERF